MTDSHFEITPANLPNRADLRDVKGTRLRAEFRAERLSVANPGELFFVHECSGEDRALAAAFVNGDRVTSHDAPFAAKAASRRDGGGEPPANPLDLPDGCGTVDGSTASGAAFCGLTRI